MFSTYVYCAVLRKAFTAFVQELDLHQHHQHVGRSEATPLLGRFDHEGRPSKDKGKDVGRNTAPSGPLKGGGGRRRQPPSTKPRGVILPLHLRVGRMHC